MPVAIPSKAGLATGSSPPVDDELSHFNSEKDQEPQTRKGWNGALLSFLEVETHGYAVPSLLFSSKPAVLILGTSSVKPIPRERRTDKRLYEMFLVWFSTNLNVLACVPI